MKSELEIIIAKNFIRLRKAHGYSLRGAAKQLGIAHSSIQNFEALNDLFYLPQLVIMERMAELYGVKVADFFVKDGAAGRVQSITGYNLEDSVLVINRRLANIGMQIRTIPAAAMKANEV